MGKIDYNAFAFQDAQSVANDLKNNANTVNGEVRNLLSGLNCPEGLNIDNEKNAIIREIDKLNNKSREIIGTLQVIKYNIENNNSKIEKNIDKLVDSTGIPMFVNGSYFTNNYQSSSIIDTNAIKLISTFKSSFNINNRFSNKQDRGKFNFGSAVNEEKLKEFYNSETGQLFVKYGKMYGIDPLLLIAMAEQESSLDHNANLPGGKMYNNAAYGICQLEQPFKSGTIYHAYNFETKQYEDQPLTIEGATDLEQNIKMGAMHFQEGIESSNGNIPILIQSYNYGKGGMSLVLDKYANQTNQTVDQVKNNYSDIGWIEVVNDFHYNPRNYIKWSETTYGDEKYIEHVLRYFPDDKTYYNYNGNTNVVDINTSEVLYTIPCDVEMDD